MHLKRFAVTPAEPATHEAAALTLELAGDRPVRLSDLCLIVYSALAVRVGVIDLRPHELPFEIAFQRTLRLTCRIPRLSLVEGEYTLGLYLVTPKVVINIPDLAPLTVVLTPRGDGFVPYPAQYRGIVEFDHGVEEWVVDSPGQLLDTKCSGN